MLSSVEEEVVDYQWTIPSTVNSKWKNLMKTPVEFYRNSYCTKNLFANFATFMKCFHFITKCKLRSQVIKIKNSKIQCL